MNNSFSNMIYSQEIIKETEKALKMLEEENRLHPGENIVEVLICLLYTSFHRLFPPR